LELHFKTTFNFAYIDTKSDQNRTWKIVSEYCCPPSVLLLYCVWRIICWLCVFDRFFLYLYTHSIYWLGGCVWGVFIYLYSRSIFFGWLCVCLTGILFLYICSLYFGWMWMYVFDSGICMLVHCIMKRNLKQWWGARGWLNEL